MTYPVSINCCKLSAIRWLCALSVNRSVFCSDPIIIVTSYHDKQLIVIYVQLTSEILVKLIFLQRENKTENHFFRWKNS